MNPLLLVCVGLAIVLGSILWLRLHPFLALMLGALLVGGLTSDFHMHRAMQVEYLGDAYRSAVSNEVVARIRASKQSAQPFDAQKIRRQVKNDLRTQKEALAEAAAQKATQFVTQATTLTRITSALGSTMEKIGILIAMACVIGRCMLASGAAERIVRSALSIVGERGAPLALSASSFVLAIPVFFDSVFLLAIPLAKATWLKTRKNYLLLVLALVTGGTMTHSLVPPTPGPMFVAEELGVNIGTMILVGCGVGLCCTAVGLLYAHWLNKRMEVPVRETPAALAKLEELAHRELRDLPGLWLSLLPVLLPVVLISAATVYKSSLDPTQALPAWLGLLGDKNISLILAAGLAMVLAGFRLQNRKRFATELQHAMQEAGLIILMCCAGGAFGSILQQSGIGPEINSWTGDTSLDFGLLPLAFLVTAVIRGAQGSSTVAMFTGVAIVGSVAPDLTTLSYHPVYLAVAIGCGSKPFPWMNDSGFWVISQTSGMTEKETLMAHTPMVTLMGFTGIFVTMLAAKIFPMIY